MRLSLNSWPFSTLATLPSLLFPFSFFEGHILIEGTFCTNEDQERNFPLSRCPRMMNHDLQAYGQYQEQLEDATTTKRIIDQDTERIRPMKLYDSRSWWKKAEDSTNEAFTTEESVALLFKQSEIVHNNSLVSHSDRMNTHDQFHRRFVTPSYHGGGGCAADVTKGYTATQRFYMEEKKAAQEQREAQRQNAEYARQHGVGEVDHLFAADDMRAAQQSRRPHPGASRSTGTTARYPSAAVGTGRTATRATPREDGRWYSKGQLGTDDGQDGSRNVSYGEAL